jgi:ribose transport system ATP-binding protein
MRGIRKAFGASQALDGVDFEVRAGEIHALLGENGAGKSTLIQVLAGVHRADAGEIALRGRASFVHQDLGLVDSMSVAENAALVAGYPRRLGLVSWRRVASEGRRVLEAMGSGIDPEAGVARLGAAERAVAAIARALAVEARLLVLDEPSAALPESDVARLFAILRRLREAGLGMVYVTHRLGEVFRLADRVTVLRDGRRVATLEVSRTGPEELVGLITGRRLSELFPPRTAPLGEPLLELDGACAGGAGPVSLAVRAGEVVALVGLRGAGHDRIGRMVFGAERRTAGSARFLGRELAGGPRRALRCGIGFVTGRRAEEALAASLSVRENLFPRPAAWWLRPGAERRRAAAVLDRFDVRPRDPERVVATLSGGNQQKVVLARWMELGSRLLVLEDPTVGVDVGARAEIYATLARGLGEGRAALLVSSDFEEVAGLARRAIVFDRGRAAGELSGAELTQEGLVRLASAA